MHTFTGNWNYRGMLLLMAGLVASELIFSLLPAGHGHVTPLLSRGMTLLMAAGVGATMLCGLIASFTTYAVDARGITRRGWNGIKQMQWSDVIRVEAWGGANSILTLTDCRGSKLRIQRLLFASKSLAEFNHLLNTHLAPIRERQLRDMGGMNSVHHPKRRMGWVYLTMLPIVAALLPFMLAQPLQQQDRWASAGMIFYLGGIELLFLHLALLGFTHALIFTEYGIVETSVFRTCRIPFHEVTSLTSRTVGSLALGRCEQTIIKGNGQKILLTAHAKDYELLTEYIRAHTNINAQQNGVKAKEIQREAEMFLHNVQP